MPSSPDRSPYIKAALQLIGNFTGAQFALARRVSQWTTAAELLNTHMASSLWQFCDPVENAEVVIHIQLKAEPCSEPTDDLICRLRELRKAYGNWQGNRKASSAKPGNHKFSKQLASDTCAISRSLRPTDACHIIPKTLDPVVVRAAFDALFGQHHVTVPLGAEKPLFGSNYLYRSDMFQTMNDGSYNGIRLTPSFHRICELTAFNPSCPSLQYTIRSSHALSPDESQELSLLQLMHEENLQALPCAVKTVHQSALHVHAMVNHWRKNMIEMPATRALLKRLNEDADGDSDEDADGHSDEDTDMDDEDADRAAEETRLYAFKNVLLLVIATAHTARN
ncbi:hypothetical protein OC842_001525 [Tilletia horrida]|uniref:Uncharacterized protein n=1 Tax=Tilletia horrida TaxID=155126 RepID=A0AAN6JNC8_9BASI|nr:hypothetical protein OC842_001525 [Tilletia horrida]